MDASIREAARKLRLALELHDAGVRMMRQKLRRDNPQASAADIERLVNEWLRERPGAEHGDSPGRTLPPDHWTR